MNSHFTNPDFDTGTIRSALRSVEELLAAEGERIRMVVVGGAAMKWRGPVQRTTSDVYVIARADGDDDSFRLGEAMEWVFTQDAVRGWTGVVNEVVANVRRNR